MGITGLWDIIIPEATVNNIKNPLFKYNVTDSWTLTGTGAARARDPAYAWRGAASCKLTAGTTSTYQESNTVNVPDGADVTVTVMIYRESAIDATVYIRDTTASQNRGNASPSKTGVWEAVTVSWNNNTGGAKDVAVRVVNGGASTSVIWFDACQMELKAYATTFISGDEPGGIWDGTPHNSTSTRSAEYRMGGRVRNLGADYNVSVEASLGIGMPPLTHQTQIQAFLDGALFRGVKPGPRPMTLNIASGAQDDSRSGLHVLRKALIEAIKPDLVAEEDEETPPALFAMRYHGCVNPTTGAGDVLEITHVAYVSGLEFDAAAMGFLEKTPLQVIAYDPYYYALGDDHLDLSALYDDLTVNGIAASLNGAWDNLSHTTSTPIVRAIVVAPNHDIYIGGDFNNWNGIAAADYVARFNWATQSWEAVITSGSLTDAVYALALGANGDLYIGGAFTSSEGHFAIWDGSTLSGIGSGANGDVQALHISGGKLYIGGAFSTINGVTHNKCAIYNPGTGTVTAMGTGANSTVFAFATWPGGQNIFVAGAFTTMNGQVSNRLANWSTKGNLWAGYYPVGFNGAVYALVPAPGGFYAGGLFTTYNGDTVNYLVKLTFQFGWERVGEAGLEGATAVLRLLSLGDELIIAGTFDDVGTLEETNGLVKYVGGAFVPFDLSLPGGSSVYALAADEGLNNLYLGGNLSGTATISQVNTQVANNRGTRTVFPVLTVRRVGGTSAILKYLTNNRTKKTIVFDYSLANGEEFTIDFRPGKRKVSSSLHGELAGQPLPGSDMAKFNLLPGENALITYIPSTDSPTLTAELVWRPRHWSADGGGS